MCMQRVEEGEEKRKTTWCKTKRDDDDNKIKKYGCCIYHICVY